MRHTVLRYGAAALCVLGAVYFLLPLSIGVLHIGMLYPAAGLLLAAVWLVFPGLFRRLPRWLRRTVCVVLLAGLLALGTILTLMGIRAAHHPDGTRPVTVIVLGCQVRSDGTPSRMLRDRIQSAYDYLSTHEEAVCVQVVCGVRRNGHTMRKSIGGVHPEMLKDTDKFPSELSCAEAAQEDPQSIVANVTAATAVLIMVYNILTHGENMALQTDFSTRTIRMQTVLEKQPQTRRNAA